MINYRYREFRVEIPGFRQQLVLGQVCLVQHDRTDNVFGHISMMVLELGKQLFFVCANDATVPSRSQRVSAICRQVRTASVS